MTLPVASGSLEKYLAEINKFPLLSREEELELAKRYYHTGDTEAAHKLVTSNLRFVIKIASEYRNMGINFIDLIQEGNIGLMKAVKKFDPYKGYRLISYAVWWIRAQIHAFIIRTWSLVKIGTTQAQRKIFAKLRSTKRKLASRKGVEPGTEEIAKELNVLPEEVSEMELRMAGRDFSLDAELDDDSRVTHLEMVQATTPSQEEIVAEAEEKANLEEKVYQALEKLSEKERFIIKNRIMADKPMTLKQIGSKFNISRERVRQIEQGTLKKVRGYLLEGDFAPA